MLCFVGKISEQNEQIYHGNSNSQFLSLLGNFPTKAGKADKRHWETEYLSFETFVGKVPIKMTFGDLLGMKNLEQMLKKNKPSVHFPDLMGNLMGIKWTKLIKQMVCSRF